MRVSSAAHPPLHGRGVEFAFQTLGIRPRARYDR